MIQRDNQPWSAAETASIDWQDDGAPLSSNFDDIYYDRRQGRAESEYTFIEGNRLAQRLADSTQPLFTVGETGFGTGLNFLLTWDTWRRAPDQKPRLHYLSIERFPMTKDNLRRALDAWPELSGLAAQLIQAWPVPLRGQQRLVFEQGRVVLDLWFEDAREALADLAEQERTLVDAWYLDGFAPARNPDMWQQELLAAVARLSRPGATAATFTAAGAVRRGLAAAGFEVALVPGFGAKRDSIRASLAAPASRPAPARSRWDIADYHPPRPGTALVIGAGLAGAATAHALARRGLTVTVVERDTVAGAASGNDQGVIYTRLSRRHSTLTDFALQSFLFATGHYRSLFEQGPLRPGEDGALCGCFQQSDNRNDLEYLADALVKVPDLASVLDAASASEHLGLAQTQSGYWLPASGWLNPPAVCRALLSNPLITVLENAGPAQLQPKDGGGWRAACDAGQTVEADVAVICSGVDANQHPQTRWLPLQPIRGQTTDLPSAAPLDQLRAVLCHEGYIAPPIAGAHCIGATFGPNDSSTDLRPEDNRHNLAALAGALPAAADHLAALDPATLAGRVGLRCASPDYLPIAGPAPDRGAFLQKFADLRNNARQTIDSGGPVMPGLYVNTGHGSRGLTSTPLVAECLASTILGEPLPLSRHLQRALIPARFLVRDLKRGKV